LETSVRAFIVRRRALSESEENSAERYYETNKQRVIYMCTVVIINIMRRFDEKFTVFINVIIVTRDKRRGRPQRERERVGERERERVRAREKEETIYPLS